MWSVLGACSTWLYPGKEHPCQAWAHMQMSTRAAVAEKRRKKPLAKQIEEDLEHLDDELSLPEVNGLLTCLWQKKEAMEKQESQVKMQLLLQFLHHARRDLAPSIFAGTVPSSLRFSALLPTAHITAVCHSPSPSSASQAGTVLWLPCFHDAVSRCLW